MGMQEMAAASMDAGDNALLLRSLVEGVAVAAQAVGRRFATHVQLLPTTMYPLLERLGDPHPLVAAGAARALRSIAVQCGYQADAAAAAAAAGDAGARGDGGSDGLREMVIQNGDYLVDALCRQVRQVQVSSAGWMNPDQRAPQMAYIAACNWFRASEPSLLFLSGVQQSLTQPETATSTQRTSSPPPPLPLASQTHR
jgi:hypothetical protein